jgi:putative CocE/NonD family hydrolase
VELSDGARLATTLFRPRDLPAPRAAAVLVRTPFGLRSPLEPAALLGRGLAAAGFHVVVQDVRGRFESEGRFDPFLHEASDGEETIRWIEEQPWYDGRLGLAGFSYAGWSALAALGAAPKRVAALAVAGVGSDLRAALRPGGAFSLDLGLRLALALAEREPPRRVDLGRAFPYRPLGEADRVAWRQTPGFRRWLAPAAPYWSEILPVLPEAAPPTLLVGGLYDPFLPALLSDHAALAGSATRLIIGPWLHPRPVRFTRRRGAPHRAALWEIVNFLHR